MPRIHALVLALSLGVAPAGALASDSSGPSLEQALIESASTPKEHAALASYYAQKAAAARAHADYHRAMAKTYGGVKMSQVAAMKEHCEKLAVLSDEQAKEFDTLASLHRDMAK